MTESVKHQLSTAFKERVMENFEQIGQSNTGTRPLFVSETDEKILISQLKVSKSVSRSLFLLRSKISCVS